jgi:DNA (cytosine-5)-methyltransferase 1
MARIIGECQPTYVFAENVQKEPIDIAANELERMGYVTAKIPCSASDVGADHVRQRYWLFGDSNNDGKSVCAINDETLGLPELQKSVWVCGPDSERVAHGVANRVDRLKMLGE